MDFANECASEFKEVVECELNLKAQIKLNKGKLFITKDYEAKLIRFFNRTYMMTSGLKNQMVLDKRTYATDDVIQLDCIGSQLSSIYSPLSGGNSLNTPSYSAF